MKRYILILAACLLTAAGVQAQNNSGRIDISDLRIEEQGDRLTVSFRATAPRRTVKSDYTLVNSPVLTDGNYRVSLAPIIVQGRRAELSRQRQEMATGADYVYDEAAYLRNGQDAYYTATVPSQSWMQNAELKLESVLFGCCSAVEGDSRLLAAHVPIRGDRVEYYRVPGEMPEERFLPQTLADSLSLSFPFVADASEFDPRNPFRIYDDEREDALIVYYHQGGSVIDPYYRDNNQTLTNIISVVTMIMDDRSSDVERIVIAGFASPEGAAQLNNTLAGNRAKAVMEHIRTTVGVPESRFVLYNGSVDWRGLRHLVAGSRLPERNEVVRIIDQVPDNAPNGGRLGELKRLNGGTTYRTLLDDYFPNLRNGAFIKVYYRNK